MWLCCVQIYCLNQSKTYFVVLCLFPSFSSAVTARRQQSVQQPTTTTQETMMNSPWRTSCKQHHNPCNNTARNNDTQSMTYIKQQIATHATTRQPRNHDTQSITYIKQQITIPDAHQATVDNPCNNKKRDRMNGAHIKQQIQWSATKKHPIRKHMRTKQATSFHKKMSYVCNCYNCFSSLS